MTAKYLFILLLGVLVCNTKAARNLISETGAFEQKTFLPRFPSYGGGLGGGGGGGFGGGAGLGGGNGLGGGIGPGFGGGAGLGGGGGIGGGAACIGDILSPITSLLLLRGFTYCLYKCFCYWPHLTLRGSNATGYGPH